jgi:hypothetical protein
MIERAFLFLRYAIATAFLCLACSCRSETGFVDTAQGTEDSDAGAANLAMIEWDQPNRDAKQSFLKTGASAPLAIPESEAVPAKAIKKGPVLRSGTAPVALRQTKTALVSLKSAPFPYEGTVPATSRLFLDVVEGKRRGHRTSHGQVYWEDTTYSDSRTLLHLPKGFDYRRPALMVLFLHGHGAILQRDVIERQHVPAQVSAAGVNAVLVAPQLAVDAADSSAGKLWEPGGLERFLAEAAEKLAKLHGDPRSKQAFETMPVVIVAYSGGYATAASCLSQGGADGRVRGVVLLDALYGDLDTFAGWITSRRQAFFLSAYASSTRAQNAELESILKEHDVAFNTKLQRSLSGGSVTFVSTAPQTEHRNFVTQAWVNDPIKDVLQRLRTEVR